MSATPVVSVATTVLPSKAMGITPSADVVIKFAARIFAPLPTGTPDFKGQVKLQTCAVGFCIQCPADRFIWSDGVLQTLRALRVLSTISISLMVIVLACFVIMPKGTTNRSIFSVGYVCSAIVFAMAFVVGLDEGRGSMCYNKITRADALHVPRCLVSGVLFVGGYIAARTWGLLWTVHVFFQIALDLNTFRKRPWILALIGTLVPCIFAFVSIPWLRSDFGPVCYPGDRLSLLLLVKIPIIAIDSASVLTLLAIFGYVVVTVGRSLRESGDSSSQASMAALKQTTILLWRPLTFTILSAFGMVFFIVAFGPISGIFDGAGRLAANSKLNANSTVLNDWGDCLYYHGFDWNKCPSLGKVLANYTVSMAPYMYSFILTFWVFGTSMRGDLLHFIWNKIALTNRRFKETAAGPASGSRESRTGLEASDHSTAGTTPSEKSAPLLLERATKAENVSTIASDTDNGKEQERSCPVEMDETAVESGQARQDGIETVPGSGLPPNSALPKTRNRTKIRAPPPSIISRRRPSFESGVLPQRDRPKPRLL